MTVARRPPLLASIMLVPVVATCGDDPTEPPLPPSPPTLDIVAFNSDSVGAATTHVAIEDSLAVAVGIVVPVDADTVRTVEIASSADGGEADILAARDTTIVPGTAAEVELYAHAVPSGSFQVFARARSDELHASDPVTVELSRPRTWTRLLSINGEPVRDGETQAVEDSFRVAIRVSVADTSPGIDRISLRGRVPEWENSSIRTELVALSAGVTHRIEFTGYVAPAGTYDIAVEADVFETDDQGALWVETRATHGPLTVQVTQSDVEPPSLTVLAPLDSSTTDTSDVHLAFEAADERGIWWTSRSNLDAGCAVGGSYGSPAPDLTGSVHIEEEICYLQQGDNRIVVVAADASLNTTADTIVVTYDPGAATSDAAAPIVRRDADGHGPAIAPFGGSAEYVGLVRGPRPFMIFRLADGRLETFYPSSRRR